LRHGMGRVGGSLITLSTEVTFLLNSSRWSVGKGEQE
jgi:hypothetical protein